MIHHWSALVGQLGRSKNMHSHSMLFFAPYQISPKSDEKYKVQIFEIFDLQNCFEKSAKAKLLKLEPFAWSH